jgi:hypothetical protein
LELGALAFWFSSAVGSSSQLVFSVWTAGQACSGPRWGRAGAKAGLREFFVHSEFLSSRS